VPQAKPPVDASEKIQRIEKLPETTAERWRERLDRLRELRVEIQDLQKVLARIGSGQSHLSTFAPYIVRTRGDIDALLVAIDGIGEVGDDSADSIRHIRNLWEQIGVCPLMLTPEKELGAEDQLRCLAILDDQCHAMVVQIGLLTIPARLNEWLREATPGSPIAFHAVFEDELPMFEDRQKLLEFLACAPRAVRGGIVDPKSGLVHPFSMHLWAQLASFAALTLAFLGAWPLLWRVGRIKELFPEHGQRPLMMAWVALLAGSLVHLGIDKVKQLQTAGGAALPSLAIGQILPRVNAKLVSMLLKILMMLFGLFGLVFFGNGAHLTLLDAFLVGFSLDSVVSVFGSGVEKRATAQVAMFKKALAVGASL
jgi:hypothetical protein